MLRPLILIFLLSAGLGVSGTPLAFADVVYLKPAGVEALRTQGVTILTSNKRGPFVRGQIIIRRDQSDLPTLAYPGKYFMFRIAKELSGAALREQRFEWRWVRSLHHVIDTIDDLRDMMSNRDKRYGDWEKGFRALLADIDSSGALGLRPKEGSPVVVNARIVPREGWASVRLILGAYPPGGEAARRSARARPPEDPLGWSPLDSRWWGMEFTGLMNVLLYSIARAEKYGEAEQGLRQACLEVAQFVTDKLYSPLRSEKEIWEKGSEKERLIRKSLHYSNLSLFAGLSPRLGGRVVNLDDDELPIDGIDISLAALHVLQKASGPFLKANFTIEGDRTQDTQVFHIVGTLVRLAGSQRAFLDPRAGTSFPSEIQARMDDLGRQAFETLVRFASVSDGGLGTGVSFRTQIIWHLDYDDGPLTQEQVLRWKVAEEVLARTGIGSASEAAELTGGLIVSVLTDGVNESPSYQRVVSNRTATGLRRILIATPKGPIRDELRSRIDERIRYMQWKANSYNMSRREKLFLERWNSD